MGIISLTMGIEAIDSVPDLATSSTGFSRALADSSRVDLGHEQSSV